MMFIIKRWQVTIETREVADPFIFYVDDNFSQNVLKIISQMSFDKEIRSIKITEKLPANPQVGSSQSGGQIFKGMPTADDFR